MSTTPRTDALQRSLATTIEERDKARNEVHADLMEIARLRTERDALRQRVEAAEEQLRELAQAVIDARRKPGVGSAVPYNAALKALEQLSQKGGDSNDTEDAGTSGNLSAATESPNPSVGGNPNPSSDCMELAAKLQFGPTSNPEAEATPETEKQQTPEGPWDIEKRAGKSSHPIAFWVNTAETLLGKNMKHVVLLEHYSALERQRDAALAEVERLKDVVVDIKTKNVITESDLAAAQAKVAELEKSRATMAEGRKVCLGLLLIALGVKHDGGVSDGIRLLVKQRDEARESLRKSEASREQLRKAIETAARTFRNYAAMHLAKGTVEGSAKAKANESMADKMDAALSSTPADLAKRAEESRKDMERLDWLENGVRQVGKTQNYMGGDKKYDVWEFAGDGTYNVYGKTIRAAIDAAMQKGARE